MTPIWRCTFFAAATWDYAGWPVGVVNASGLFAVRGPVPQTGFEVEVFEPGRATRALWLNPFGQRLFGNTRDEYGDDHGGQQPDAV